MFIFKLFRKISITFQTGYDNSYCVKRHLKMSSIKRSLKQPSIKDTFTTATKSGNDQMTRQKDEQKEEFEFFFGPKFVFSQFHPAKFKVDDITYNCMEQYMHHQKAVTFNDKITAGEILKETDPKKQKKLGRKVTPFDKKVWGQKSVAVVKKGSLAKYRQNAEMKKVLFATYPKTLVECSPRDTLWGIGLGRNNDKAKDRATWRGKNLLGQTLTEVRNKMMAEESKNQEALTSECASKKCQGSPSDVCLKIVKTKGLDLISSYTSDQTPSDVKEKTSVLVLSKESKSEERKSKSKDSPSEKISNKHDQKACQNDNKDLSQKRTEKKKSSEHRPHSGDRVRMPSSQERISFSSSQIFQKKGTKEKKEHIASKDKEDSPSKKRKWRDNEPEKLSKVKDELILIKDKNEHSPTKKRKVAHIQEETETKGKEESTPSKNKGESTPSKKRKITHIDEENETKGKEESTPSKNKGESTPSKKRKETHIHEETETEGKDEADPSKDKGESTPSMKRKLTITHIDEENYSKGKEESSPSKVKGVDTQSEKKKDAEREKWSEEKVEPTLTKKGMEKIVDDGKEDKDKGHVGPLKCEEEHIIPSEKITTDVINRLPTEDIKKEMTPSENNEEHSSRNESNIV